MTILSLLVLFAAAASVILTSEHARRCGQIEHITQNVNKTEKVLESLGFLKGVRYCIRNIARLVTVAVIYGGLVLGAFFWAESVHNLMYLSLGSASVALVTIVRLETRITRHRDFAKGGAA